MTKPELIKAVAKKAGFNQEETRIMLNGLFEVMTEELVDNHGEVTLFGIGTLKTKTTAPRNSRNLHTGESIMIPGGYKVAFKPSLALKKKLKSEI